MPLVVGGIKGDVPAIGRMVVTDTGGTSRWTVVWGLQSRYYDPAATAALFFEAESRTPLGGAATAVGATGASGTGSNVMRQATLTPAMQAMLSTKLNGGQHMSHVGSFAVFARVYTPTTNTGAVSVALEWGQGDFRKRTTNDAVEFDANHPREGQFVVCRLGQVHIDEVSQGLQRWEGRILASSTVAGDDLDVDWIGLIPLGEGDGELSAVFQFENPTSISARDEFDQSAGVLHGKTLPVGGTWDTDNSTQAGDFSVETAGKTAQRTSVSDTAGLAGRFAIAGTTTFTDVAVQVDIKASARVGANQGVLARYVDGNNWFRAYVGVNPSDVIVTAVKNVAGVITFPQIAFASFLGADQWATVRLVIDAGGRWLFWAFPQGSKPGSPILQGQDAALATGGALASGKVGFFDFHTSADANTRSFDNFMAYVPTTDAAIFASQSLELTHQGAEREDSTGAFWSSVSSVQGSYFTLYPAGREGRQSRIAILPLTNDPDTGGDPGGPANITVQVHATPRGVSIPTP